LPRGPLQVESQQLLEALLVAEVGGPAIGGGDGGIEALMGQVQPGGTLVVKVGEGAFLLLEFASFTAYLPVLPITA
jgi:hypothetical protein